MKHVGRVGQLLRLLFNCSDYAWMAMAETSHRQATEEIQVPVAVGIVEVRTIATHECQWHAAVVVEKIGMGKFDNFGVIHESKPFYSQGVLPTFDQRAPQLQPSILDPVL